MDYIKGKFKRIIYENTSGNGYKIGLFRVKDASDNLKDSLINHTVTFTGTFYELIVDENYIFNGNYIKNGKYGYQFQVQTYEHVKPEGKDAVLDFLTSPLVKGCGEKTAKQIIEILGEDALKKIKEDKNVLLLIPKLGNKKIDTIYESIIKYQNNDDIILYLNQIGFSMKDAMILLNSYGQSIKEVIDKNVYSLINEIDFKTLDKIFFNLHDTTDDNRIYACIIETMKRLCFENGDTYLYIDEIRIKLKEFKIDLSEENIENYFILLQKNGQIKVIKDKIFLYDLYYFEKCIAESLFRINSHNSIPIVNLKDKLSYFSKVNNVAYNDKQVKAIETCFNENVSIITGGPGTGKTTIIKAITGLYIDNHEEGEKKAEEEIALLAPTGRAAKRMSDLTNLPASTIHRFLKWDKDTNKFEYNKYNKRPEKFIIVDEASMLDTEIFYSLLQGISENVKLVIVGDDNQLPSVGPGLILTDLISSECFNHVPLSDIYRQSETSSIPYLCASVKNHDLVDEDLMKKSDFSFLEISTHIIKDMIKKICELSITKEIDSGNIQVLAPMYKGENGIDNLNIVLQELFNPNDGTKGEIKIGDVIYREGDKVLQLINNPDSNIYNGDIGYINVVDDKCKDYVLVVNFYGNAVYYKREDIINLKHAYVISIHKSQGSEFEHVILPMSLNYGRMLYNKLLYTGISRAKKTLTVLGSKAAFYNAVNNDYSLNRKTNLVEQLLNNLK